MKLFHRHRSLSKYVSTQNAYVALHACSWWQSLDDMIAALMSMGFELQDAQDAVQYGKISTQEAVEWYVKLYI